MLPAKSRSISAALRMSADPGDRIPDVLPELLALAGMWRRHPTIAVIE